MGFFVSAIIAAAGDSSRMKIEGSKQFIILSGKPLISYTLSTFEDCPFVDEIIVVCRPQDKERIMHIAADFGISKMKACVSGGSSRAESVKNGVEHISGECTHIAIHDGARPLVTEAEIENTILNALVTGACSTGVPVTDTIKYISDENIILNTLNRSRLFAVRTPQVFEKELYLGALAKAESLGEEITDDCRLAELSGKEVSVICGEYTNIKLTTPADILYAEAILKGRER